MKFEKLEEWKLTEVYEDVGETEYECTDERAGCVSFSMWNPDDPLEVSLTMDVGGQDLSLNGEEMKELAGYIVASINQFCRMKDKGPEGP